MRISISAIIPTYNRSALLRRAIDSVLAQSVPAEELIVVDDGSTDDTEAVVRSNYGERARYIKQENAGTSAARNRAAREARGEWLSFLDHDDEWLPQRLERHTEAIAAHPETALVYSSFYVVGHRAGGQRVLAPAPPAETLYPRVRLQNLLPAPAMSIRRDAYLSVGGFNEALRGSCEDWDLLVRITRRYPATGIAEPLLVAHEQASSQSRRYVTMLERELSIVEPTLLDGLTGWRRRVWRNRIRSSIYERAAIGAREAGAAAWPYLMKSFRYWPVPESMTGKSRLKTFAADVRDMLRSRRG